MKKRILLPLAGILTIALVTSLGTSDAIGKAKVQNGENSNQENVNTVDPSAFFPLIPVPKIPVPDIPLPKSLDNLYPPNTPGSIWLFNMFELGQSFMSIADDLSENEFQNAEGDFINFKTKYEEIRNLVPEWTAFFPTYPLKSFEAALKSKDKAKMMAAFGNIGQVCENCHVVNMPKAQQKYHWKTFDGKTFSEISVKDQQTNENISFKQLMLAIDININGIGVDLKQNQVDKAKGHSQGLNTTFQMMKETCKNCHTTERKYYVDESVQAMIDNLGQTLTESPVNMTKVETLSQGIGMEGCLKCHWVHFPAAATQAREGLR